MPTRRRLRGDTHSELYTVFIYSTSSHLSPHHSLPSIIKKYSNFVSFPVKLNGELVNTVSAIWTMEKSAVTEEQVG